MYILGISCFYHDGAAVIIKDGVVIAAAEEERFSRIKHDSSFPGRAIAFCLEKAKISQRDIAYVVFYEKPLLKFERIFRSSLENIPHSFQFFNSSMKEWFFDKLWIKSTIMQKLDIQTSKLLFCEHHLSHAASAFYSSPYRKAALLTLDAVGEWTTTAWGVGNDTSIDLKEEIKFPDSLGLLYSVFTVFTGFEPNEGEYKMMGLAPYGKPRYKEKIYELLEMKSDGSYRLKQEFLSYPYSLNKIYTSKFESIFGKPNNAPDKVTIYYADIAASIQQVTEEILIRIVNHLHKQTKLDYLCYAGGVALNSSANWKIRTSSKFKGIYIQPAAGDSGGALGAALWAYHSVLGRKRKFTMEHAYLGAEENTNQIKEFLVNNNINFRYIANEDGLVDEVSNHLASGKVIGWVQNRFEWGPRALGNRSILADPRSKKMKNKVNSKIKFREAFRPFAPSVAYEDAVKFFEIKGYEKDLPLQYMLYVVPVKKNVQKLLQAVTHQDGTARPQLVKKETNPRYYKLIKAFGEKTGLPVVLNTSFNLKGEPIVNTSKEAYSTFMRSGLDILVLDKFIIDKRSKK